MSEIELKIDRLVNLQGKLDKKHTGELPRVCVATIQDICDKTNPSSILELGFNRGTSSLMWLMCSSAKLVSTDRYEKLKSVELIQSEFPNRFEFVHINHDDLLDKKNEWCDKFDLIFIDGGHQFKDVYRDIVNSLKLNPTYIALDDYYHPAHQSDIQKAVKEVNLEIIKEYKTGGGQVLTRVIK